MSHHLDSPAARQDPRLDITDLYVFRGERGTAFAVNVSHSIAGTDIPRGFHPDGHYEFKIDGNGDAVEDLTYRFTFTPRDVNGAQTYEIRRLTGAHAGDPHADGVLIAQGVTGRATALEDGARVWAGEAGDPFWIDADVLHAAGRAFHDGTRLDLGEWTPDRASNLFAGHTVYTLVLELSDAELLAATGPDRQISVWAVTRLATDAGGWHQINRAGLPMLHPLFTQHDEHLAEHLNLGGPAEDAREHAKTVAGLVAGTVAAYGTAEDPEAYGAAVAARLLPNVLPYTVGTPAAFGFASWNGRSLTDNTPDVMFSLAANTPITIGLSKDSVTDRPTPEFPYLARR